MSYLLKRCKDVLLTHFLPPERDRHRGLRCREAELLTDRSTGAFGTMLLYCDPFHKFLRVHGRKSLLLYRAHHFLLVFLRQLREGDQVPTCECSCFILTCL